MGAVQQKSPRAVRDVSLAAEIADASQTPGILDFEREFDGVVLVADMAGYTRFADALTQRGARGTERLGQVVGLSMSRYFRLISEHGGILSSLAGDAVIAHWPCESPDDLEPLERSFACARALVQTASPDELPVHAGLGFGRIWAGSAPDFDRDGVAVLGGAATRLAFRAAKLAKAGEVIAPARLSERVSGVTAAAARGNDARPLADEPLLVAASQPEGQEGDRLRPTASYPDELRPLPQRFEPAPWNDHTTGDAFRAELRHVAALFIRLLSFDERQPGSWHRHREALAMIQEEIGPSTAAGRLVIDDRGLVSVSVFGEPDGARLDPPEMVAERALRVVRLLERRLFHVAAGLAFGRAFCGYLDERMLVSVGSVMNLAARLMDLPARGLLIAGLPEQRRPRWMSPRAQPVSLRGIAQPVDVIECEHDELPDLPPMLFGREEEQARVSMLLFALQAGRGGACLLRGDPGMGKTLLLDTAGAKASALGMRALRGRAHAVRRAVPYFTWRNILRELLEDDDSTLNRSLLARVVRAGQPPALLPLLNAVFPSQFVETAQTEALSGSARAEATLQLLLKLLKDAVSEPLLLMIDDAHHADSASLELIERVAQSVPNVLLLVAARPGPVTSEIIYRLSGSRYHQVDLRALTRSGIAAMTRNKLRDSVDVPVLDLVEAASGGNPLYVQEYVLLLRDGGSIARVDGRWALEHAPQSGTPESVLAAISSRVHVLQPRDQQVLKIASALGDTFSRELLSHVATHLPQTELDAALSNLEHHGLLVQHSVQDGRFGFSHALVREAAYDLMLPEQRERIHTQAARILEEQREHVLRSSLPELVHHYLAAGDEVRTLRFAQLLAAEEMRQGAYREAVEFLRLCLSLSERTGLEEIDTVDRRIRWNRELSEAVAALGDAAAGREYAEKAAQLAGVRVRRSPLIAFLQTLFAVLWCVLFGRRKLREREERAQGSQPLHRELSRVFRQLAYAAYFASDSGWFVHYTLRALSHAERARSIPELPQMLAIAGACLGYLGLRRTSERYIRAAAALGERAGSAEALGSAHMASGLYFVGCGQWRHTREHVDACQRAARSAGNHLDWGHAQAVRFWMHWYRGQDSEAEQAADELLTQAEASGNRQHRGWAQRFLALLALRRGEPERALSHIQAAQLVLGTGTDLNEVTQVAGVHAAVLLALQQPVAAASLARDTLQRVLHSRRPTGHALLEGCGGMAQVLLHAFAERPHDAQRRRDAQAALHVLERIAGTFPVARCRYHRACAAYWSSLGRTRKAAKHKRLALAWAKKLGLGAELQQLRAEP